MFACYYCQQIPTSRAADAHYNCKRASATSSTLPRSLSPRGNIRMHWDVHSEVFRVPRGAQPFARSLILSSVRFPRQPASRSHKGGEFNIFEIEEPGGEKLSQSPLKDDPTAGSGITSRPRQDRRVSIDLGRFTVLIEPLNGVSEDPRSKPSRNEVLIFRLDFDRERRDISSRARTPCSRGHPQASPGVWRGRSLLRLGEICSRASLSDR